MTRVRTLTEAETLICDRCAVESTRTAVNGEPREEGNTRKWGFVNLDRPEGEGETPWRNTNKSDLCPGCLDSFREWMGLKS